MTLEELKKEKKAIEARMWDEIDMVKVEYASLIHKVQYLINEREREKTHD